MFLQMTPDSDYILDTHPRFKNIAIGAGFSGKEPSKWIVMCFSIK